MIWPILFRSVRVYAPYITLPFAALIGFIGYNLENKLSSKYTPYNDSIQKLRDERLRNDEKLENSAKSDKLKINGHVLERNLSPSLKDDIN